MNSPHRACRRVLDPFILPRPGENPLADLELGWSPRSSRRRRHALIRILAPTFLAVAAFATLFITATASNEPASPVEIYLFSALITHIPFTLLILAALPLRRREPIPLKRNWDDYRMAGLSARQILIGLASARLHGARLYTFYSLLLIGYVVWIILEDEMPSSSDDLFYSVSFLVVCLDYCLVVPMTATLDLTLWTRPVLARAAAVILMAATTSLWVNILFHTLWEMLDWPAEEFFTPLFILPWFLARLLLISFIWHSTLRRLDTVGP